jgi:hypothetical protein
MVRLPSKAMELYYLTVNEDLLVRERLLLGVE